MCINFSKLIIILGIWGCTNSNSLTGKNSAGVNNPSVLPTGGSTPDPYLKSVRSLLQTDPNTQDFILTVFFSASSNNTVLQVCPTIDKCFCQLEWDSVSDDGSAEHRTALVNIKRIQSYNLDCDLDSTAQNVRVYTQEISDGTSIGITIVGQNNLPLTDTFQLVKNPQNANQAAVFLDDNGTPYTNILRYTCFSVIKKSNGLISYQSNFPVTAANGNTINIFAAYSSHFVNTPAAPSVQNYVYNLYTPGNQLGSSGASSDQYICPIVNGASLHASFSNSAVAASNTYFPYDQTFALFQLQTKQYSVPVSGVVGLSGNVQNSTFCAGDNLNTPSGLQAGCLGYALAPQSDGSCPSFQKSTGEQVTTYRLRRYVSLLPKIYSSTGYLAQADSFDTIYVLDRPVISTTNSTETYSMLGPKPCPYSVSNANWLSAQFTNYSPVDETKKNNQTVSNFTASDYTPRYYSTAHVYWQKKNMDGTIFPNRDLQVLESCAAVIPEIGQDANNKTIFSLNTYRYSTNPNSAVATETVPALPATAFEKVVRPYTTFWPHFVEDTSFQACAPRALPFVDPPLHLVKNPTSSAAFFCAETVPSLNVGAGHLNSLPTDWQTNFKTLDMSAQSIHAGGAVSRQINYDAFAPLLAASSDLEGLRSAADSQSNWGIMNDNSFRCALTSNNGVIAIENRTKNPLPHCCKVPASLSSQNTVHLEPSSSEILCQIPSL